MADFWIIMQQNLFHDTLIYSNSKTDIHEKSEKRNSHGMMC